MSAGERSYRLLVAGVLGAGSILLLPLAVTLFPAESQRLLHRLDAFLAFCSGVLTGLDVQLPPLGLVVLGLLALALASCLIRTTVLLARTRRSSHVGRSLPAPARLRRAAQRVGLSESVCYVTDLRSSAYCVGVLRPAVVVSEGALRRLRDDELEAVLCHEAEHLRRRDPLRILVARSLAALFVGLPLIDCLAQRFELAKELDADRAAIRALGDPAPLAGALLALGSVGPGPALAVGAWSLTRARIDQLSGTSADRLMPAPTRKAIALTVASLVLALVLALGQGVRAHALPGALVPLDHQGPGSSCPLPGEGILL